MNYQEIEKLCEDEQGLMDLLMKNQPIFDEVDGLIDMIKNGIIDNPQECISMLSEFTGLYMALDTTSTMLETEKKNKELNIYHTLRTSYEDEKVLNVKGNPKKFLDSAVTKETALKVQQYRKVRNIFQSYLRKCEKGIGSCQSVLRYLGTEKFISKSA